MNYEIEKSNGNLLLIQKHIDVEENTRLITVKEIVKALKLYDNLQNNILILTEELSHTPSTQLRHLLEEFVRIRDE